MHKWFSVSFIFLNTGKCHYMLISNGRQQYKINLSDTEITISNDEKLKSLIID